MAAEMAMWLDDSVHVALPQVCGGPQRVLSGASSVAWSAHSHWPGETGRARAWGGVPDRPPGCTPGAAQGQGSVESTGKPSTGAGLPD